MAESQFVYVSYIRTTPEKLWEALIAPEFTRKYWCETWQDCEWKVGTSWSIMTPDGRAADSGEVLEFDPHTRLSVSWQNHLFADLEAEGFSRLTYELEAVGDSVKLTLTHVMDRPESKLVRNVSMGWPAIISSLKSMIETGESLESTRRWPEGV